MRPRDWEAHLFSQMLTVDAEASEYPYCQIMAYYRCLDEGAEDTALVHLEHVLARSARSGKAWQHLAFMEASFASANIRRKAGQARVWRDRARKVKKPECPQAVDASIAMCEGDNQTAIRQWQEAKAHVIRRRLDSGLVRFAQDRWARYEAACRAAQQGPN